MENVKYAELLEKTAARLRKLNEPISQKTIDAIEQVTGDIIKEGKKTIELSEAALNGMEGIKKEKVQKPTPEYQKIIDEANEKIEEIHDRQARAIVNSKDFIVR